MGPDRIADDHRTANDNPVVEEQDGLSMHQSQELQKDQPAVGLVLRIDWTR